MLVDLDDEHTKCSVCFNKFSCDINNTNPEIRKYLPVLSSSQKCDHWFCHGCVLNEQLRVAEENNGRLPKWIKCMICREKTSFNPAEPKYHRLLIDLLGRAQTFAAAQVKAEEHRVKIESVQVNSVKQEDECVHREGHNAQFEYDLNGDKEDNGLDLKADIGIGKGSENVETERRNNVSGMFTPINREMNTTVGGMDEEKRLTVGRPTLIRPSVSCHGHGEIGVKEEEITDESDNQYQNSKEDENVPTIKCRQMECAASETKLKSEEDEILNDEEQQRKVKRRKLIGMQSAELAGNSFTTNSSQISAQDDAADTRNATKWIDSQSPDVWSGVGRSIKQNGSTTSTTRPSNFWTDSSNLCVVGSIVNWLYDTLAHSQKDTIALAIKEAFQRDVHNSDQSQNLTAALKYLRDELHILNVVVTMKKAQLSIPEVVKYFKSFPAPCIILLSSTKSIHQHAVVLSNGVVYDIQNTAYKLTIKNVAKNFDADNDIVALRDVRYFCTNNRRLSIANCPKQQLAAVDIPMFNYFVVRLGSKKKKKKKKKKKTPKTEFLLLCSNCKITKGIGCFSSTQQKKGVDARCQDCISIKTLLGALIDRVVKDLKTQNAVKSMVTLSNMSLNVSS